MPCTLAVGAAIADTTARTAAEERAPQLVIPAGLLPDRGDLKLVVAPPPSLSTIVADMQLVIKHHKQMENLPLRKESAWERANPNQPWYAKFDKKRGRKRR